MKQIVKRLSLLVLALLLICMAALPTFAYDAYNTYTYSIDGKAMESPAAYSPGGVFSATAMGLADKFGSLKLKGATDIVSDESGNLYIADSGNNRIVMLNSSYKAVGVIDSYVDEYGRTQTLTAPQGVFVTNPKDSSDGKTSYIYVCDTGARPNARIVIFDRELNYVKTLDKPENDLLDSATFKPIAMAVDKYGRIFIVSPSCFEGVIVMSSEGDFTGFIGAQKVTYSVIQMIWRRFQTREQIAAQTQNLSKPYNNITVDDDGFVYVTTNQLGEGQQFAAITSKNAAHSPVKKLNSAGTEIMKRNGFFDPGGEVDVLSRQVSSIIDVAVGPEGSWSIMEESNVKTSPEDARSRIFTYDQNGNLLFAFGDKGDQMGNAENYVAFTYQQVGDQQYIVALDNATPEYKITVYTPTEYCETILSALRNQNQHNYSASINYWQDVLTRNNNFDLAYIGIGKALYSQGDYNGAMDMFKRAYETDQYSKAFNEVRNDVIGQWLLPLAILIIAVVVLFVKFLGWAKKKNKVTSLKVGRKTYGEEMVYCCHLAFHPFDGFWDLKHEKRGSVRAAITILAVTVLAFFYQAIGRGYAFNPKGDTSTVILQLLGIFLPVILWVVANWCLTSLFDGEGSFKDIFVATCYSLTPLPLFVVLSTIFSNVLTTSEGQIVTLLVTLGYVWVGLLLFFGMLVTHDYTLGKNFVITLFTILAMMVIMFVAILFSSLLIKMVSFVIEIVREISNRV